MKNRVLLPVIFLCVLTLILLVATHIKRTEYTILLTGASFASWENGWFEIGSKHLNAKPLNKAVNSETIADTANKIANGELYTPEELEEMDALVIMQVHDRDVAEFDQLKEDYTEYELPFDRYKANYSQAYDYVIKRYLTDCYNLKFDEKSKYYDMPSGKPAVVVLCTHWHDSREIINSSVRRLAEHWGFPVIEFDKNIGFSKSALHPVIKEQTSLLFSFNAEKADSIVYGWHPQLGEDKYIQQRMAAVFASTMSKVLPLK